MTKERRQDVVLVALIFSVALHVGLMLYMRPQVMAHVNAGIYLLPRPLLETIPAERPVSLETECLPRWAAAGVLRFHPVPPPLLDMGTPDGLAEMERFLSRSPTL